MDDQQLAEVRRMLMAGEEVRVDVLGGRLHIDRQLPFLLVYRYPPGRPDGGTADLVLGEASYLVSDGDHALHPAVTQLVETIAKTQSEPFGGFLLLELWAGEPVSTGEHDNVFTIHASRRGAPGPLLEEFETALLSVALDDVGSLVRVVYDDAWCPPGLVPLEVPPSLPVVHLGLEVPLAFRDSATDEVFPFELRSMRHGLGRALKLAFYEFVHSCTATRPAHFRELGRQAMTDTVFEVDRLLADLSDDFDLVLHVTPMNASEAEAEFAQSGAKRTPEFVYRSRTVDPDLMKRRLYEAPIEIIEDPTLARIFEQKRSELDRQLTMIADRNTHRFLLGSRALYGDPDPQLISLATGVLETVEPRREGASPSPSGVAALADRASEELAAYRSHDPSLRSVVQIRDDVPGVMVSAGNLLIGRSARIHEARIDALVAHEIGTHVLTHHNGRQQPFRELYAGMAGYESLQEGLAVLWEFLVGGLGPDRLRQLAGRVIAVTYIVEGADFVETCTELRERWGFTQSGAFDIAMRVFRSGGFTKDVVYLRGLAQVLDYLATGEPFERLHLGKVSHAHLDLVEELEWRTVLVPPRLLPRHLERPDVVERLDRCRSGLSVLDLIEEATG